MRASQRAARSRRASWRAPLPSDALGYGTAPVGVPRKVGEGCTGAPCRWFCVTVMFVYHLSAAVFCDLSLVTVMLVYLPPAGETAPVGGGGIVWQWLSHQAAFAFHTSAACSISPFAPVLCCGFLMVSQVSSTRPPLSPTYVPAAVSTSAVSSVPCGCPCIRHARRAVGPTICHHKPNSEPSREMR